MDRTYGAPIAASVVTAIALDLPRLALLDLCGALLPDQFPYLISCQLCVNRRKASSPES
jgi:hypothetical protein